MLSEKEILTLAVEGIQQRIDQNNDDRVEILRVIKDTEIMNQVYNILVDKSYKLASQKDELFSRLRSLNNEVKE